MEYNRKVSENLFLIQEIEDLEKELMQVRRYKLPKQLQKVQSTSTNENFKCKFVWNVTVCV